MRQVLTGGQMRDMERRYFAASGASSLELMERAAAGVVRVLHGMDGAAERIAIFVCGPGGNGGDGFAAARLHAQHGGKAIVVPLRPEAALAGDARTNCELARTTPGVAFAGLEDLDRLPPPAVWVDAMFGIGLKRPLEPEYLPLVRRMAEDAARGARVLAVDVASGLDADTGRALGEAVRATDTVTFECPKAGHLMEDGLDLTGHLHVVPIGIPEALRPPDALLHPSIEDVRSRLKPRARNSHKGSYGHLLIVAGSRGMAGAAALTALGALKSGVGLVTVACPESIVSAVQAVAPCAMCLPLPERDGAIGALALEPLERAVAGANALAVGPGLTTRAAPAVLRCLLESGLPAAVDADALNLMARDRSLIGLLMSHHVLTPHPREAERLLGTRPSGPIEGAMALRALGATALYKGASSVIAGDALYIRTDGTPGMATGGTGDVLTGIIGALLAQGYPPTEAAFLGAVAHGAAGERAAARLGAMAMTARDLADHLHEAWGDAH